MRRSGALLTVTLLITTLLLACAHGASSLAEPASRHAPVTAGVRLHFLDFGGAGDPVVLLAGPGNTAWIFDGFGQNLAHDFRVFAVTRRGHGQSDMPRDGYDQATLVEDILGFLNSQGLRRAHLVGASTAGEEMTRFASRYPDRVGSLVYLDAAYDRSIDVESGTPDRPPQPTATDRNSVEAYVAYLVRTRGVTDAPPGVLERNWRASVAIQSNGTAGMRWGEAQFREYMRSLRAAPPDYSRVQAPALAIYATAIPRARLQRASPEVRAAIERHRTEVVLPWRQRSIAQFRHGATRGEVVELNALHHPFLHRPQATAALTRRFLKRHPL